MEEYEFYGALFVKTKWYMIIEYKQQSILETQILEFPDISDNSSFPTRAGQGVKLSRVFVFLCSLTCIPNSKMYWNVL